eukprot:TRINITY_DN60247_c0_g1_i1.p1 TRINITY_DN60247_c0_g1~~TRINITY_DN60247_c0_g1_i1.p1  ORF type:complete len:352 (+),score=-10.85 TRINITY_DN60247_c0_g1_i1:988-2043(+)
MEMTVSNINIQETQNSRLPEIDFNNIPFGKIFSDHMFVADYKDGAWQDSRIIPFQNLSMNPGTCVLHYAQSIFEGLKGYRSDQDDSILIFRPRDNAKRMDISAKRMCMPDLPEELFMEGLSTLIDLDRKWVPDSEGSSLYIRPFLFATDEYIGLKPPQNFKFMILTSPVGAYYSAPVKVKIETHYTRAAHGGTGYAKAAGNYAASLYPALLAQQNGYDQLIWTDAKEHKYIEEAGTMNVMFIIGDTLITAPTGDTILAGITRDSVLTLAKEWGLKVEERPVAVAEVIDAIKNGTLKEAFGAGTAATIAHIELIGHEGTNYNLPDVNKREFSHKVLNELEGIKHGTIADTHG